MKEFVIRRYRSDQPQGTGQNTLVRTDDEGRVLFADHHAESVLGYDTSELEGLPVHRILASRQDDPFAPANRHRIESGQDVLITLKHKEGYFYTASLNLHLAVRDSDKAASASIIHRDNSAIHPGLLRSAESSAGFGIWELDIQNNEMTWTEGIFKLLELRPGTKITPDQALFYCQTGQARVRAMFRKCIRVGEPFTLELNVLTGHQNLRRIALSGMALKSESGGQRLGGTLVDRTREMHRDQARQQAEQMIAATTQATPDLVAAVDMKLNLIHFNQPFAQQFYNAFGITPALGDNLTQMLPDHPNERRLIEQLWQRAFERGSFIAELPLAQQGRELPVYEFRYQRLTDDQGETTGAVQVAREMGNRANYTGSSEYRLRHDPVTGLMNRRELISRLERTIEQKASRESCDSLLYLDLDKFEHFNDLAGRGTCDRYLRELSGNLGIRVRQRDSLARLSGDTFALLIENCPEPRARKIAEEILAMIHEFVFEWQGHKLQATASGGLLIMEHTIPTNPEQLLSQVSDLCHTAKISGRNRIHTAHVIAHHTDQAVVRMRVEHIRQALNDDNLILEYQSLKPVTSATWGDHIEILCRIHGDDEHDEMLRPDQFLMIAERFDLAKQLDRQVIRQTFAWLGQHRLLEPRLKYCGFNLSLASVMDDTFVEFMERELANSAFAPECFCFEIRESHATQYPDDVAVLCDSLHKIGCRVALDGAGASVESYSLAAKLPVDIVKLDRRMMDHLDNDPVQHIMTEALHRIAETAGKTTVATFIESDDVLRKVRAMGIHYGQGHRLSKPQPLAELTPAVVDLPTGRIGG